METRPSHQTDARRCVIVRDFQFMLGARAAAIVRVRIAALVVGIDIAKPRVAGVVVVAAATGEALTNAWSQDRPNHGTFPLSLLLRPDTEAIQPPIRAPISTIRPDHTP